MTRFLIFETKQGVFTFKLKLPLPMNHVWVVLGEWERIEQPLVYAFVRERMNLMDKDC